MSRFTAAVEAELALLRRAIQEATHARSTPAKVFIVPAAAVAGIVRLLRTGHATTPPATPPRHRGAFVWDAGGNFVPLNPDPTSPAPDTRGSETARPRRIG